MTDKDDRSKDQLLTKLRKIMRKGDKKSSTFAAEEALKFYKRSLDTLEKAADTPENTANRVETLLLLAEILYILGRWDTAISYLDNIQKMGPKKAGLPQVAEAYRKSGHLWALKGDIDRCFDDYGRALDLSKELGDAVSIADAERGLGYAHWRRGNIQEAERHYEAAFKALESTDDEELMAKTYLESGNVFNDKGDLNKAVDYYMKAVRVFRKARDIYQEARAYNNLGDVCIKRKDWKKGIRYFEKTAELADSINDLHMQGWALFNAAECYSKGAELEKAEEYCTKALDMLSRIDDKIGIAYVFCNYGIVYRFKKEWAKSLKYFKFSINIVKNLRTPGLEAYVLKEFADMNYDWGKADKAVELALEARRIYSSMGAKYYVEMVNELLARFEGKGYRMDITMSREAEEAVEEEVDVPDEPDALPADGSATVVVAPVAKRRQTPREREAAVASGKMEQTAFSDGGPIKVTVDTGPTASGPEAGGGAEVAEDASADDNKVYLFMPAEEDTDIRRQKARFFVKLPFMAPELDFEEVKEGERPDLSKKVKKRPSVMLMGKVYAGIPSVEDLVTDFRSRTGGAPPQPRTAVETLEHVLMGKGQTAETGAPPNGEVPQATQPAAASAQEPPRERRARKIDFHYGYLVEADEPTRAIDILKAFIGKGASPLIITRPPARKIRDLLGGEKADMILFSTSRTPKEGLHPITDLDDLGHQIEAFMNKHPKTVVMLDRAEVMIQFAGFDAFLRMLHHLNECLDTSMSSLLVPMDPHLIGKMELRTLKRELSPL